MVTEEGRERERDEKWNSVKSKENSYSSGGSTSRFLEGNLQIRLLAWIDWFPLVVVVVVVNWIDRRTLLTGLCERMDGQMMLEAPLGRVL